MGAAGGAPMNTSTEARSMTVRGAAFLGVGSMAGAGLAETGAVPCAAGAGGIVTVLRARRAARDRTAAAT